MTDSTPVPNSYIDTIEAADILAATRPNSAAWIGTGKAPALQEATRRIDALPLRGRRYEDAYIYNGAQKDTNSDGLAQILEFPRIIEGEVCDWDHGAQKPIVPALVKLACIEEAIAILASGPGSRRALQEQGVQSFSIGGKLSETFRAGVGTEGLISAQARRYMRRYMGAELR
jgi:hypothetical protein